MALQVTLNSPRVATKTVTKATFLEVVEIDEEESIVPRRRSCTDFLINYDSLEDCSRARLPSETPRSRIQSLDTCDTWAEEISPEFSLTIEEEPVSRKSSSAVPQNKFQVVPQQAEGYWLPANTLLLTPICAQLPWNSCTDPVSPQQSWTSCTAQSPLSPLSPPGNWSFPASPTNVFAKQNSMPPGTWSAKPSKVSTERRSNTTVMLRNIPNDYTRDMFLQILDDAGLKMKYDFVYMPMDFLKSCGLGYAFVNLRTHEDALKMWEHFDGFNKWVLPSQKVMAVSWGKPTQGFDALVDRFRNSSVLMQPDECHPVVFDENGVRRPFPKK